MTMRDSLLCCKQECCCGASRWPQELSMYNPCSWPYRPQLTPGLLPHREIFFNPINSAIAIDNATIQENRSTNRGPQEEEDKARRSRQFDCPQHFQSLEPSPSTNTCSHIACGRCQREAQPCLVSRPQQPYVLSIQYHSPGATVQTRLGVYRCWPLHQIYQSPLVGYCQHQWGELTSGILPILYE